MNSNKSIKDQEASKSLEAFNKLTENYCETTACRRETILRYFGENIKNDICNKSCDYCSNKKEVETNISLWKAGVFKKYQKFYINYIIGTILLIGELVKKI